LLNNSETVNVAKILKESKNVRKELLNSFRFMTFQINDSPENDIIQAKFTP